MNEPVVQTQIEENGILVVLLNRPEKLNVLNEEVLRSLSEIFTKAKTNPQIKALLLSGSGKAFCAGADISRLATCEAQEGYEFALEGQRVFRLLETLGKPSLAAINGFAFGGGCELAMAATVRIASVNAQFGQPEVKLGVIPGYGGTQRMARLIGRGRALDLCLTGRFISAETAERWGLVTELTSPEELLPKAKKILSGLLNMAPLALTAVMEVIDQGLDLPLLEALDLEAKYFANLCESQDKQEGVRAFLEKRSPQFVGA